MIASLISPPRPLVVAHRGFTVGFPENTLPAFQAALDLGADVIETDAHASRDGHAMLSHDPGLQRVAGRGGLIDRYSKEQLQDIDLGGATMPTLREALEQFPHVPFSIDVKHPRAIGPVIDAVIATDSIDRVLIASFSNRRRRLTARGLPGVATLGTQQQVVPAYLGARAGLSGVVRRSLRGIRGLFLPRKAFGTEVFHPRFVDQVSSQGLLLGAWTINDPAEMEQLWRRGVHAMVTDRIDLAVDLREAVR